MFENVLTLNNISYGKKTSYKSLISAGLIALAVVLPQLVHIAIGQPGGVQWLPMYLPVLIGGCLLGAKWGFAVGALSPIVSFLITSVAGSPMPAAPRLPFMIAELAIFALVSGLFTNKISKNGAWAFAAVVSAQIVGRGAFLGLAALFGAKAGLSASLVWSQIQTGFAGLAVQIILVPAVIMVLKKLMQRDN